MPTPLNTNKLRELGMLVSRSETELTLRQSFFWLHSDQCQDMTEQHNTRPWIRMKMNRCGPPDSQRDDRDSCYRVELFAIKDPAKNKTRGERPFIALIINTLEEFQSMCDLFKLDPNEHADLLQSNDVIKPSET